MVGKLQAKTKVIKEEQGKQQGLMESILQLLNNLALSYDRSIQITTKLSSREGTSNTTVKIKSNILFNGQGSIQARTLCLDFPKFDGGDVNEWILKVHQFFAYCQIANCIFPHGEEGIILVQLANGVMSVCQLVRICHGSSN